MTRQVQLQDAVVELQLLRDQVINDLRDLLFQADGVEKNKCLVLDKTLIGPLGLVVEFNILKELGVEKLFYLEPELVTDLKNVIYILQPRSKNVKMIVSHINTFKTMKADKRFYINFVPKRRTLCDRILEQEGVLENVKLGEFQMDLIPFDKDLVSMELGNILKECMIEGDKTELFTVARALMKFQHQFGIIPNIFGKGDNSMKVVEHMFKMRKAKAAEEPRIVPEIDYLIMIDRDVDMITPLCTQLTYEGLIDEVFSIIDSTVELPSDWVFEPKRDKDGKVNQEEVAAMRMKRTQIQLNSADLVFSNTRDSNFAAVGVILNKQAKQINDYYEKRHEAKTTAELKTFLENFGTFQKAHGFLRIHTRIVEALVTASKEPIFRSRLEAEQNLLALSSVDSSLQFVEKCIRKREPVTKVLRILSLYSLTNGGIEQSKLEQLRLMIMKTYGYGFLPTIENLTKLGMIECSNNMYSYKQLKKDLSLITLDMDVHDPKDFAYVYSGFSPISVRLIEKIGSVPVPSESNNVVVNTNSTSGAGGRGRGGVPGRGAPGRGVPGRGRQDGRGRAKPQIVDEFDDDDMIGPQEKVIVLVCTERDHILIRKILNNFISLSSTSSS
eukprot:TRINITY_DN3985_c0_g1_i5.p1 TRINITY_DN3985_c0_g1~~TRINITY_DN3985_c0_g1_i5.p1  ORF type:complete len:613 (+),score=91.35 TRINITY_DN3985_c0_g1_i5:3199-5037(+)